MPGQCYGCGVEFGMFKKEHGCKNCGFSFCSKCLSEKSIPIPKKNNAKHRVCLKCLKILNGQTSASAEQRGYDLPEAYLKRMAALRDKESGLGRATTGASTSSSVTHKNPQHLQRLSREDREIAVRLEKLKEDRKAKVSDTDLTARLAQLKGQTYDPERKPTVYQAPDRRTQVEQVDDLMEQLCEEVKLDSLRPNPVADIESRLAHLRYGANEEKRAVDGNNMNQQEKSPKTASSDASKNDLGKENKMGAFAPHCSKNIQGCSDEGEMSVDEMQELMAQAARELEQDAQRHVAGLYKDEKLLEKLREIQAQGQQEDTSVEPNGAAVKANPYGLSGQIASLVNPEGDSSEEENEDAQAD